MWHFDLFRFTWCKCESCVLFDDRVAWVNAWNIEQADWLAYVELTDSKFYWFNADLIGKLMIYKDSSWAREKNGKNKELVIMNDGLSIDKLSVVIWMIFVINCEVCGRSHVLVLFIKSIEFSFFFITKRSFTWGDNAWRAVEARESNIRYWLAL